LFACFVSLLFLSSLPSAANKGPPSRLQQQQLLLQQQKELHLQETLQTRSGAKPRRRPIAASASCATAMGKKPSEIRQKETPKRKAFVPSVQRYFFFPANGVFWFPYLLCPATALSGYAGGGLFMPTFAKGQKSARKKLEFTPPLYTRSQGQCSTQIKHFYWCKKYEISPPRALHQESSLK
jgi:hypothetical protein